LARLRTASGPGRVGSAGQTGVGSGRVAAPGERWRAEYPHGRTPAGRMSGTLNYPMRIRSTRLQAGVFWRCCPTSKPLAA